MNLGTVEEIEAATAALKARVASQTRETRRTRADVEVDYQAVVARRQAGLRTLADGYVNALAEARGLLSDLSALAHDAGKTAADASRIVDCGFSMSRRDLSRYVDATARHADIAARAVTARLWDSKVGVLFRADLRESQALDALHAALLAEWEEARVRPASN